MIDYAVNPGYRHHQSLLRLEETKQNGGNIGGSEPIKSAVVTHQFQSFQPLSEVVETVVQPDQPTQNGIFKKKKKNNQSNQPKLVDPIRTRPKIISKIRTRDVILCAL